LIYAKPLDEDRLDAWLSMCEARWPKPSFLCWHLSVPPHDLPKSAKLAWAFFIHSNGGNFHDAFAAPVRRNRWYRVARCLDRLAGHLSDLIQWLASLV